MTQSYDDYLADMDEWAPLYFECTECGNWFKDDRDRCVDSCGGKVIAIYKRDIETREDRSEPC